MYGKLTMEPVLTESINYAMQQNYVPAVRKITVTNTSQEEQTDLRLTITSEPGFIQPFELPVEPLAPGQTIELAPIRVVLVSEFMLSVTERVAGNLSFHIYSGEEPVCHEDRNISVLAYDQWTGSNMMPELLAAFVLPNHQRITEVLLRAGEILNQWTNSPSMTGYQSNNPTVVKHQMAAIYAALQKENIAYTVPPASFESVGQRIRLCDAVLEQHLGSCLDLSLVYASCLEAAGLNPVILLMKGHAFAGCWLEELNFPETVQDDAAGIRKRIAEGIEELCLVECTDVVVGKSVTFDEASAHGAHQLDTPEDFVMLIDIARSRSGGIRPIPMRILENGVYRSVDYGKKTRAELTGRPQEVEHAFISPEEGKDGLTRQKLWERKLLDLSLRNMLLSFRVTQNTLQLMAVNLDQLEDALSGGSDIRVMPRPDDWTNTLRDSRIYELENADSVMGEFAQAEFKNKRIRTFLEDQDLENVLKNLSRRAKISLEENGTNTLYLGLGFLKWYESDISQKERLAPLVLIPVDLVRKLQERSFALRIRDEEPQINITLLELLRQDYKINITGLDPLPTDDTGLNLKVIFNTVRQAVMGQKRWDVEEYAFLGLFSFSQFIMWNDLRNRSEELKKNKTVASLISGKLEWQPEEEELRSGELDDRISPSEHAVPMSADSTQMLAVCSAAKGQSFVLHGPPGTGKSQTITNMIANALYQGKSVLFVAEKMAALSVVQKRLKKIGLDPFCLELHSNKARKKDVLDQLDKTLQIGRVKSPEEYNAAADRIRELRNELNAIMRELHEKRHFGFSLYEAIAMYEKNSSDGNRGLLHIDAQTVLGMQPVTYGLWMELLHKYRAAILECGGLCGNPLQEFCSRNYSVSWKQELQEILLRYRKEETALRDCYNKLRESLAAPEAPSRADLTRLLAVCEVLDTVNYIPETLFRYRGAEQLQERVTFCVASGKAAAQLEKKLMGMFDSQVFSYDYRKAALEWKQAKGEWFVAKAMKTGRLLKELKLYAKQPEKITKSTIEDYYEQMNNYYSYSENASSAGAEVKTPFGMLWSSEHPNWDMIENVYFACLKLQKASAGNPEAEEKIAAACADRNSFLAGTGAGISGYRNAAGICSATEQQLWEHHKIYLDELYQEQNWFSVINGKINQWLLSMDNLKAWCIMLNLQDELVQNGIGFVTELVKAGTLLPEHLLPAFECALGLSCANEIIESTPALSMFHGAQFDEKIERFRSADEKFRELTINEIVAKLSARIPSSSGNVANSSEIGILQRAIKSGGRMMPIRKLFDSIPTLLRMLCPCMLMSPISVAQYIDPKFPKFDVVIFDEASQLPTCEAVGAIARGENVIVVGDPKQLPPTSFFETNRVDEENFEKEDLESVLDDCLALSMPQKHLLWHYRSRHESLIAYSNMQYYENKLYTFPSPNDLVSEVIFVPVDGVYDRSRTKQNPAEGDKIVEEIVRRLRDPELQNDSIGVVTFSVVQQHLIEDLLEEAFRKEPELELVNQKSAEPIFIKNLENVQGDERDVILFSIGYGPDKDGKVTLNFGPLNRDGGWRRLNVAISRARKQMMIFSTLRPEQIDAGKTMADGVLGLKGFLEFASRGKNVLVARQGITKKRSAGVEESVAEALRGLGYEVKCSIGCSEYKIDLGIVDPEDPERYLLGILCDGNPLGMEMMARDRSILQPDVLKSLGWSLYRLWTLDWLDTPERELSKIKEAITAAVKAKREKEAKEVARELAELNGVPLSGKAAGEPEAAKKPGVYSHEMFEKEAVVKPVCHAADYETLPAKHCFPTEEFYLPKSRELIGRQIGNIIEREGPVCYKRLCRKELAFWGIARSGAKIEQMLSGIIREGKYRITKSNGAYFYWKKSQEPECYQEYRTPTDDPDSRRDMDEIAAEEISNAIIDILTAQVSLSREDLVRETAKVFGFTRIGAVIQTAVENGLETAKARGQITDGERITLRG